MSNKNTLAQNKLKYEGKTFSTNWCGDCVVIDYRGAKDITVKFEDTGFEVVVSMSNLKKGEVKDRLKPSFYGVGIIGEDFVKKDAMYNTWMCMLNRCYGAAHIRKNSPYKDCTVSENFKYYPYFKAWCEKQNGFNTLDNNSKVFAMDKDILVKGNKVYSEDTCCFVPREINNLQFSTANKQGSLPKGVCYDATNNKYQAQMGGKGKLRNFIGRYTTPEEAFQAYKEAKEAYIKELANKWKDKIDNKVYEALMTWEISIDD